MNNFRDQLHPSWNQALKDILPLLDRIEESLETINYAPPKHLVMSAFSVDLSKIRVVIFGQDPYPQEENCMGLAFAIPKTSKRIPASLRNIFKETEADVGKSSERDQDLACWVNQGVMLLNRTLTIADGVSGSHKDIGWREFTLHVARVLGEHDVIAILWGRSAFELAPYFKPEHRISSAHPSPLSAYRGFFGSKPFSRANQILKRDGHREILW